jgi:hypothetical protein
LQLKLYFIALILFWKRDLCGKLMEFEKVFIHSDAGWMANKYTHTHTHQPNGANKAVNWRVINFYCNDLELFFAV